MIAGPPSSAVAPVSLPSSVPHTSDTNLAHLATIDNIRSENPDAQKECMLGRIYEVLPSRVTPYSCSLIPLLKKNGLFSILSSWTFKA